MGYYTNVWSCATSTTASTHDPWDSWCSTITATTNSTGPCWRYLLNSTSVTQDAQWSLWNHQGQAPAIVRSVDPEELRRLEEERAQRDREWHARLQEERAARLEAERKAEELMMRFLSPEQRDEFRRLSLFTVHLPNGNRYQVRKGHAGNVYKIGEREKLVERLCIHTRETVPDFDNMLAQKLFLESNEDEFRRVANVSRYG